MHVTSHGYWTHRLTSRVGVVHPPWAAFGAMLPDLPAAALTVALRAAGRPWRVAGDEAFEARFEPVHSAMHAAVGPVALVLAAPRGSRRRALAVGWAGHLVVDLASHHTDARPPAWPFSRRVWRSPISHWEPAHHAAVWNALDALALSAAARSDGRRAGQLAALVAAAVAAAGIWEAIAGPVPRSAEDRIPADGGPEGQDP